MTENTFKIILKDKEGLHNFLNTVKDYNCDIDAIQGSSVVEAKSETQMSSLGLNKPLYIQLHSYTEDELSNFKTDMVKFAL